MRRGTIRLNDDGEMVFEYKSGQRVVKDKNGIPYRTDVFYARIPLHRDSLMAANGLIDQYVEADIIEDTKQIRYESGDWSRSYETIEVAKLK